MTQTPRQHRSERGDPSRTGGRHDAPGPRCGRPTSPARRPAERITESAAAARLGDAHEAIERWLGRLLLRQGPASAASWRRFARRLRRLMAAERELLDSVREARVHRSSLLATHDPLSASHGAEFEALMDEAEDRAARGDPWHRVVADVADFLAWSFISVEHEEDGA